MGLPLPSASDKEKHGNTTNDRGYAEQPVAISADGNGNGSDHDKCDGGDRRVGVGGEVPKHPSFPLLAVHPEEPRAPPLMPDGSRHRQRHSESFRTLSVVDLLRCSFCGRPEPKVRKETGVGLIGGSHGEVRPAEPADAYICRDWSALALELLDRTNDD